MDFEKASHYRFGDTVKVYSEPGNETSLLYEFKVLDEAACPEMEGGTFAPDEKAHNHPPVL